MAFQWKRCESGEQPTNAYKKKDLYKNLMSLANKVDEREPQDIIRRNVPTGEGRIDRLKQVVYSNILQQPHNEKKLSNPRRVLPP